MEPIELAVDLERRANRLLDAAKAIRETYGLTEVHHTEQVGVATNGNGPVVVRSGNTVTTTTTNRLEQLLDYLRSHGPTPRRTLIAETKIPLGTLANLLRRSEVRRDGQGNWCAVESGEVEADEDDESHPSNRKKVIAALGNLRPGEMLNLKELTKETGLTRLQLRAAIYAKGMIHEVVLSKVTDGRAGYFLNPDRLS